MGRLDEEAKSIDGVEVDGHKYRAVKQFCYLGDMLSQGGGCEHAVAARIRSGWAKFRELSGLVIGKGTSLHTKGVIYATCIRPAMLYGSETWAVKCDDVKRMQRSEMRMLRWMAGVNLSERKSSEFIRGMLAIEDIARVMQRNRLRWVGHIERREESSWLRRIQAMEVDGCGVRGRPRMRWKDVVDKDLKDRGMKKDEAQDRAGWRSKIWKNHR